MLAPQDEIERLFGRSAAALADALRRLTLGIAEPDEATRERAVEDLAALIRATQIYADLLGRYRVWREVDAVARRGQYADPGDPDTWSVPEVPNVPFQEAYEDLLTREPRIIPSAEEIGKAYSEERVFALARSAEVNLTERIQKYLLQAKRERKETLEVLQVVADMGDFSRAYARTIYRTNLASAYSAGRRAEAQDPAVQGYLPAFRFTTARDRDVRRGRKEDHGENHAALEGYLAATDHPVWRQWSPPLSYNCRCALRLVAVDELKRIDPRGRWRSPPDPGTLGAAKHPNFVGRFY